MNRRDMGNVIIVWW